MFSLYTNQLSDHTWTMETVYTQSNPVTKKNKRIIENVQRRNTKPVPELRDLPYERRLEELDLPTSEYRRQRFDMIILYKMLNNKFDFDYKHV